MAKHTNTEKAAIAAAKALFADQLLEGDMDTFSGTLDFTVDLRRGESHTKSNPQKARPWSLVQVLLSKLNATIGESAMESWLEEGIKEAQFLTKDQEDGAKDRVEEAIATLLPEIEEKRAGNITVRGVSASFSLPVVEKAEAA